MGVPTTKLFLNNNQTANAFYSNNKVALSQFLEEYGPAVKSLRVGGIEKLADFEADCYGVGENSGSAQLLDSEQLAEQKKLKAERGPWRVLCEEEGVFPIPAVFKQLQVVKIGQLNDEGHVPVAIDLQNRGLLTQGESWEYVRLPFHERRFTASIDRRLGNLPEPLLRDTSPSLLWGFAMIQRCVENIGLCEKLPENSGPWKYNLKEVDFATWNNIESFSTVVVANVPFLKLCKSCVKKNVKLENIHAFWFLAVTHVDLGSPEMGIPIRSLVDLQPCILPLEMPNLEKIVIRSTYHSSVGNHWREERPEWPALKILDVSVDSKMGNPDPWMTPEGSEGSNLWLDTKQIFSFFFQDVVRPNLIELRFNFVKEAGEVAVPKAREIAESCPNLKKMSIVNWPGKNKDLLELFGGLPGLEELSLENCENVGNVTFVGLDTRDPLFFKLKKLKKLTLKGLDEMPKITDLLFTMVLRHLSLTHFLVTSRSPIESVTSAGIRSLLEGDFAKSIEKFPFQDWSLEGVSSEEFRELGKQFRSYNML